MKKIYTITFSNTTNVGASLQEFALFKFLENNGYRTKVVDYRPNYFKTHRISIKKFLMLPLELYEKYLFVVFQKKVKKTKICKNVNDVEKLDTPDYFICGSDQIWNPNLTFFDKTFYLDFFTKAKKIAYAGSIGEDYLTDYAKTETIKLLSGIKRLSVREEEVLEILPSLHEQKAVSVLDPVFLLEKEEFLKIEKNICLSKYVLIYEAEINPLCAEVAKKIAKKNGLKTVQIKRINNRYNVDKVIPCVSPEQFVALIHQAEYIVTNSFHGIAMSIIFEKQFVYIPLCERASRINSLLNKLGIEISNSINGEIEKINYRDVNKALKVHREISREFLRNALAE